jgi:hypothetical protein
MKEGYHVVAGNYEDNPINIKYTNTFDTLEEVIKM